MNIPKIYFLKELIFLKLRKENEMKKITIILISFLLFASGFSQAQKVKYPTQKGFVRTIGRYYDTKEVTSIYRIKDVGIYMSEGIGSKSDANGEFSLKPTKNEFTLSKVEKKGFKLISPSNLPKIFYCNPNDLEIVMADMNEELRFRRDTEKKIEIALRKEYDQKILELDSLYKQSKISQEQWKRKYNEIIQRQEKDREMVKKIAEEYSEIDFAKMDEIKKKIAELIINGKLKEAVPIAMASIVSQREKILPIVTNNGNNKYLSLANSTDGSIQFSVNIFTQEISLVCEPYLFLNYNGVESLAQETLSFQLRFDNLQMGTAWCLDSEVQELKVFGLFAPTEVKKGYSEEGKVETISWTPSANNWSGEGVKKMGHAYPRQCCCCC